MAQIQYIKHLWEEEGKSLREISRITGMTFRTVQKYAYKDNWSLDKEPEKRRRTHHPVLGPYIHIIDEWLLSDLKEPRKQRHTVRRIHSRLRAEYGFQGSYECVKDYVRAKKKQLGTEKAHGFLPLNQPKAHAQIDFGQFKYYDTSGIEHIGHTLIVSFPYSNAAFIQVFQSENQECLLEGLRRIFTYIGGVPIRIKADNMTTAVAHVLKDGGRVLSDGFVRFMLHYRFQADFCNLNSGHEKGHVEGKVGYSRRNFFVPIPVIEDFEEYNSLLFQKCVDDLERPHYKHSVLLSQLWQEESQCLLSLPENDYAVFRLETVRINNYGCVVVDTNHYGVTPELAGELATIKVFYDKIEIYHEHTLLKT